MYLFYVKHNFAQLWIAKTKISSYLSIFYVSFYSILPIFSTEKKGVEKFPHHILTQYYTYGTGTPNTQHTKIINTYAQNVNDILNNRTSLRLCKFDVKQTPITN